MEEPMAGLRRLAFASACSIFWRSSSLIFAAADIGPVDREEGDDLHQRLGEAVQGKVPGVPVAFGDGVEEVA